MQVKLDNNNYFTGSYAKIGGLAGGVDVDNLPNELDLLKQQAYKLVDGIWQYDADRYAELTVEPSLAKLKTAKLAEVSNWTKSAITGGFTSSCTGQPVQYDSDEETQITMQGIALNCQTERFSTEYPTGCPVRGYDAGATEKTVHMLTGNMILALLADMSAHIGACKLKGWQKQTAVNVCTTKEELDAITWAD